VDFPPLSSVYSGAHRIFTGSLAVENLYTWCSVVAVCIQHCTTCVKYYVLSLVCVCVCVCVCVRACERERERATL
jgi:hypothetical protein